MARNKDNVTALPARTRETVSEEKGLGKVITTGAVRALEEALERAKSGHYVGVTIIGYSGDGGWHTSNAGSIMRNPAIGIAAAHVLASHFTRKIEDEIYIAQHADRRT